MSSPAEVYHYLLSPDVPSTNAQGMLANTQGESGFRPHINGPTAPGSAGGYGLFRHTRPWPT